MHPVEHVELLPLSGTVAAPVTAAGGWFAVMLAFTVVVPPPWKTTSMQPWNRSSVPP